MCCTSGDRRDPGFVLGRAAFGVEHSGAPRAASPHHANHLAPSPASPGRSDGAPLDLSGSASPYRHPRPGGHVPRTRRGRTATTIHPASTRTAQVTTPGAQPGHVTPGQERSQVVHERHLPPPLHLRVRRMLVAFGLHERHTDARSCAIPTSTPPPPPPLR